MSLGLRFGMVRTQVLRQMVLGPSNKAHEIMTLRRDFHCHSGGRARGFLIAFGISWWCAHRLHKTNYLFKGSRAEQDQQIRRLHMTTTARF